MDNLAIILENHGLNKMLSDSEYISLIGEIENYIKRRSSELKCQELQKGFDLDD